MMKRQARGRKGDLKDVICLSCLSSYLHLSKKQARSTLEMDGTGV
jgi:hypothetical protein